MTLPSTGLALSEGAAALRERPMRVFLGLLGPMLAAATLLAVAGSSASASAGVDQHLRELSGAEVTTQPTEGGAPLDLDWRIDSAVERIDGVQASAVTWMIPHEWLTSLAATPRQDRARRSDLELRAASPHPARVAGTQVTGRFITEHDERTGSRVAVVGVAALRSLAIPDFDALDRALLIDGTPFAVIGVVTDVATHAESLSSVLIPTTTARELWGAPPVESGAAILTRVRPGAGEAVADQAPVAISPTHPEGLVALPPLEPASLRRSLLGDLSVLGRALTSLAVAVGTATIIVSTLSGLRDRRSEIALRRAIGARRADVAAQVASESIVMGVVGGAVGIALGIVATAALAAARGWPAVLEPRAVLLAVAISLGLGAVTGALAAVTAARVDPAQAIRS